MDLETLAAVSLPIIFLAFMGFELVAPSGRPMPDVRWWRAIGIAGLIATLAVNALLPLVILPYLPDIALLHLDRIGLWAAVPTVVLTTFFTYWSHRIQHRFDILWRLGHQLHHSVARVDIASAFIFHPVDVFVGIFEGDVVSWYPAARRGLVRTDVFPPSSATLLGVEMAIPASPEAYLERLYGAGWRTPDPDFMHPWNRSEFADLSGR